MLKTEDGTGWRAAPKEPLQTSSPLAVADNAELAESLNYRGHIAGLDVLRGVAVLSVLISHAYGFTTSWTRWHGLAAAWIAISAMGHLGVHLFFILSGFLISGILLDGRGAAPGRRARGFYLRRARRILPAYLLILAVLLLTKQVDWHFVLAAVFFVVNLGRLLGVHLSQYPVAWSLAVEEQFYLVWPWVVWRCSLRTITRVIVACLLLSPLLRLALVVHGADTYTKTYANVDYLMYGALVALLLRTGRLNRGNLRLATWWLYGGGLAGLTLLGAVTAMVRANWVPVVFPVIGRLPFVAIFLALLLSSLIAHQAAGGANESGRPATQRSWIARQIAFLGYISYGLYLVHPLVFHLYDVLVTATRLAGFQQSFALLNLRALVCSFISILLAWLSRSTLEAWFLRRRGRQPKA